MAKVISLIQPWATLIALEEKFVETRGWPTKYRGEIYIHASKKINKDYCEIEPFKTILAKHGYNSSNLPTGQILAKCNLIDCLKVVEVNQMKNIAVLENSEKMLFTFGGNEYWFGEYDIGRYGFLLADINKIEPIPAKGQLGIWNFNI